MGKKNDGMDFVGESMKAAEQEFGSERLYVAADHEKRQFGVEIPALPLRWLIDSNIWPLQRLTLSAGKFATQKSSFIFQLERWYLEAGGMVVHVDTENKTSSSLMMSMIPGKYFTDPAERQKLVMAPVSSVEDWQQILTFYMNQMIEYAKKHHKKPGLPILWAVDSLMGADAEENLAYVEKEGEAKGRTFSVSPLLISNFMKYLSNELLGWPVTAHISNHEKVDPTTGHTRKPGGSAPDFHATLDLRFVRMESATKMTGVQGRDSSSGLAKPEFEVRGGVYAKNIGIQTRKNSMGPDNRKIVVPFCYTYVQDSTTNTKTQSSWWDWYAATPPLLIEHATLLKDVIDVTAKKREGSGALYWSKTLEISDKDPVPPAEMGRRIHENLALFKQIEDALHIQQHQIFSPEVLLPPVEKKEKEEKKK